MKKIGNSFTQITYSVFVQYENKTYLRKEYIINGISSLSWEEVRKNEYNTWDTYQRVSDIETFNILNNEYYKMIYFL